MDAEGAGRRASESAAGGAQDGGSGSAKSHAGLARYFFGVSAEAARAEFDPAGRWEEFVEALWEQVDAGFGLTGSEDDFPEVPRAWFDHPNGPPRTAWEDGQG